MTCKIKVVDLREYTSLRTRTLDPQHAGQKICEKAQELHRWYFGVDYAGSVPNSYKYPAWTEGYLAVSDPTGKTVVWWVTVPANKVTYSGVVRATGIYIYIWCLDVVRRAYERGFQRSRQTQNQDVLALCL